MTAELSRQLRSLPQGLGERLRPGTGASVEAKDGNVIFHCDKVAPY